jgi:acyl-coenzyme A synthetase/AMP-(fatty) acid ligase
MLPGFHCMGFFFQLLFPLITGYAVAIFEPQYPDPPIMPTPSKLLESLMKSKANAAFVVPAFLEVSIIMI